jgi:hypothetical protein
MDPSSRDDHDLQLLLLRGRYQTTRQGLAKRGALQCMISVDLAGRKTEQKYGLKISAFSSGDVAVRLLKVITEFIGDEV